MEEGSGDAGETFGEMGSCISQDEAAELEAVILDFVEAADARGLSEFLRGIPGGVRDSRSRSVLSTALLVAAKAGRERCVRELLSFGANVNHKTDSRDTSLHLAVEEGHLATQQALIQHGAEISVRNIRGFSPLDLACERHNEKSVSCLLKRMQEMTSLSGKDRDSLMYSAMLEAAEGSALPILHMLVNAGGNVNLNLDHDIGTSLHVACETGSVECVDFLIRSGANIEALRHAALQTALSRAAQFGHVSVVERLLQAGADINRQTHECSTALSLACHFGHSSVVRTLIDHGADPLIHNRWGFTPLFMAADDTATLREILREKVDVDELVGERGEAAIHLATVVGSVENCRLLLEYGSSIDVVTLYNETPLWLAAWRGHVDLARLFLRLNCSLNDKSNGCQVYAWDYMPLEIAIGNGGFEIANMMLTVGCSLRNDCYFPDDSPGTLDGVPWLRLRPEVLQLISASKTETEWVRHFLQNTRSLKDLSRICIRKHMARSVAFEKDAPKLPVPRLMQDYVLWVDL